MLGGAQVTSDPELELCLMSTVVEAVVVVELRLRLSNSSAMSSEHDCIVTAGVAMDRKELNDEWEWRKGF